MSDLNNAFRTIAADAETAASRRTLAGSDGIATLVTAARRRRRTTMIRATGIGIAAVAVLAVGGVAGAGVLQRDPLPPVVSPPTSTPTPTSSATSTPSAAPSPTFVPDMSGCATPASASTLHADDTASLWFASYGGWAPSATGEPVYVPVDIGVNEHWGGESVQVTPLEAFLVGDPFNDEPDSPLDVVGVPATPLSGSMAVTMSSGTFAGGDGSQGRLELRIPFLSCDGSGPVADGSYNAWVQVRVERGDDVRTAWLVMWTILGDYVIPGTEPLPDLEPLDLRADPGVPACGSVYDITEVRYVEGEPLLPWFIGLAASHLAPIDGRGTWGVSVPYGSTGTATVVSVGDPVAVLVRQSDQVVVSRTPLSAVREQYLWQATGFEGDTERPEYPHIMETMSSLDWVVPTACVTLDEAHPPGSTFDAGDWHDDRGLTVHVGQRVVFEDGTAQWFWTSDNPNDPVYAP